MKQEFLALKWVIAEQLQNTYTGNCSLSETDNNPLTYIVTIPNLDANQHQWVEPLTQFTFHIEYQKRKGQCSHRCPELSYTEAGHSNCEVHPGWIHHEMMEREDIQDLVVSGADEEIHRQVQETVILARAAEAHVNLHVTDWATTQQRIQYLRL